MQLYHLYHNNIIDRVLRSDFRLFELSIWLHVLARSLITVFIPILMLQAGYTLSAVIWYYVLYNAIDVPLNFFADWLTRKIGARLVIIISKLFAILFFASLGFLNGSFSILVVLATLAALYDTLYWVAHLYLFTQGVKDPNKSEKRTGVFVAIKKLAALLGPAIGAFILIFFNQNALIVASVIIFALAIIPLLKVDDFPDKPHTKRMPLKQFFSHPRERKNFFSTALWGIHGAAEGVLWPIFIFITFVSIESVALIPIIVSIGSMIFAVFVGRLTTHRREIAITIGAFLIALIWIGRLTFDSSVFYYGSVFLVGLFSLLVSIPLVGDIIARGKQSDALATSTYRNMVSMLGKFFFYGLLALLVNVFEVGFAGAALSLLVVVALYQTFISTKNQKSLTTPHNAI